MENTSMDDATKINIHTRVPILLATLFVIGAMSAIASEPWEKGACREKGMNYPVVDFHAHTFNFRHLPLRGILYGWGVPDFVAGISAEIFWGVTGSYDSTQTDKFAVLRFEPTENTTASDYRGRILALKEDLFDAIEDPLTKDQQDAFITSLNEYLVNEIEYEQTLIKSSGAASPSLTPISDFFNDLTSVYGQPAGFNPSLVAHDGRKNLLRTVESQPLIDRLAALLVRPFDLPTGAAGTYRFLAIMIQAEDQVVNQLLADNCGADYFVHHMMDLAPVYDDDPPVSFEDQHVIAKIMRERHDNRLISFSAFTPFRYDEYDFNMLGMAVNSGVVGVKYYPPSGYSATVERIPKKPPLMRGLIYQGGARKQWKNRYKPLRTSTVQNNWGVKITDPKLVSEQTLEGISNSFFNFARTNSLPIFTHQTPHGFESYPGYGNIFAEPCDWVPLLNAHPEQLVIMGHSGGDTWYKSDKIFQKSFALQAFNLCVTYENVYCDFGYHEDVLSLNGQGALRARLNGMHNTPIETNGEVLSPQSCRETQALPKYSIFKKILYGSDWMMVIKEDNYEGLLSAFNAVFSGDLEQYKSLFFGGNAITVLNKSKNANQLPKPLKIVSP